MKNILIRIFFLLFLMGCTTLGHTTLLNYDGGHSDAVIAGKNSAQAPLVFSLPKELTNKQFQMEVTVLCKDKTAFHLNTNQLYVSLPDLGLSSGDSYTVVLRIGDFVSSQKASW